jgi:hypothetical protein
MFLNPWTGTFLLGIPVWHEERLLYYIPSRFLNVQNNVSEHIYILVFLSWECYRQSFAHLQVLNQQSHKIQTLVHTLDHVQLHGSVNRIINRYNVI